MMAMMARTPMTMPAMAPPERPEEPEPEPLLESDAAAASFVLVGSGVMVSAEPRIVVVSSVLAVAAIDAEDAASPVLGILEEPPLLPPPAPPVADEPPEPPEAAVADEPAAVDCAG